MGNDEQSFRLVISVESSNRHRYLRHSFRTCLPTGKKVEGGWLGHSSRGFWWRKFSFEVLWSMSDFGFVHSCTSQETTAHKSAFMHRSLNSPRKHLVTCKEKEKKKRWNLSGNIIFCSSSGICQEAKFHLFVFAVTVWKMTEEPLRRFYLRCIIIFLFTFIYYPPRY